MAIVPASTPGPTITTSNSAQISEFTDRVPTMMNNITARTDLCGVVLCAARKAMGTARIMAIAVPMVAIFNVSQTGRQSLVR